MLDGSHSEVGFTVRHMMITKVHGTFDEVAATMEAEEGFKNAKLEATIQTKSVNTRSEDRDNHLRSADFFNVEQYPVITFKATVAELKSGKLEGEFTINGVTKNIALDVEFFGEAKDPWGNVKVGFSFEGSINRKDFGLTWNAALDSGGVLVSEEVKLRGDLQFVKQA